ncbi:hypothetical protein ACFL1Y_02035, partial [Patescibacteria group bacterium]
MKLEELINLYKNYIENKFHKFSALLISFLIVGLLFIVVHPFIKDDIHFEWISFLVFELFVFSYWLYYKFKYPKNSKKKKQTGLVISLFAENIEEERVKNEFIRELKRNINISEFSDVFNVIKLKNHLSEKVENQKDLDKLHKKTGGHLYLYGDIQKSKDGKDEKYFISLNGLVRHMPVPISISKSLSLDFRQLLPKEVNFSSLFELRGCKFTAQLSYLMAKYIAGVASL